MLSTIRFPFTDEAGISDAQVQRAIHHDLTWLANSTTTVYRSPIRATGPNH